MQIGIDLGIWDIQGGTRKISFSAIGLLILHFVELGKESVTGVS